MPGHEKMLPVTFVGFFGGTNMGTVKGGSGSDVKYGTTAADLIYGYAGDDSLYGKAGADQIWGGSGKDKLVGEDGNDILHGDDGADHLLGGNGWDILYGGAGNDKLFGEGDTDTLKGEAGNDILNGGSGIAYLYGGDGEDQLNYNPTKSDIFIVGNYLAPSILDGDAGTDTLNISNEATFQSFEGTTEGAGTAIYMTGRTSGQLYFEDQSFSYINVGKFQDVEKLTVAGKGGLEFNGYDTLGTGTDVTGTAGNDFFSSFGADDIMRGGAGNDQFTAIGGHDTIISESNDADHFTFSADYFYLLGETDITGFNGVGTVEGDQLHFVNKPGDQAVLNVATEGGKTIFDLTTPFGTNTHVTVDAVGLVEGVDYFFA
jgi:Ca2+-binding RTX toxin-like protein